MMELSDRHCRMLWRLLSPNAVVYTEMVTTGALIHGNRLDTLAYSGEEHPIALQLGGCDPKDLGHCSLLGEKHGFDEINLNVGCPSDRVQRGMIGAVLMKHADLVANAFKEMANKAANTPITIKHRIGVDEYDSYDFLRDFVGTITDAGCKVFIVHARKAFLSGLSPKDNREVPPLIYDRVYQLKKDFPDTEIILNGGVKTTEDCEHHLNHVDGVMIGREAYYNPMILANIEKKVFGKTDAYSDPIDVIEDFKPYLLKQAEDGEPIKYVLKHLLALISERRGARQFRRHLSENMHKPDASPSLIDEAVQFVR